MTTKLMSHDHRWMSHDNQVHVMLRAGGRHKGSVTAAHRKGVDGVHEVGVRRYVPLVVTDCDETLKQVRGKESTEAEPINHLIGCATLA